MCTRGVPFRAARACAARANPARYTSAASAHTPGHCIGIFMNPAAKYTFW